MPSKKKKYNSRFPPARIKKIMQSDDEVGKVAQVVPIIISKALEIFVASLLQSSSNVTRSRNARTLTPHHIKQSILSSDQFSFLREIAQTIPDVNPGAEGEDADDMGAAAAGGAVGPQQTGHSLQRRASENRTTTITSATSSSGHQLSAAGQTAAIGFRGRGRPRKRTTPESQSSVRSMTSTEEQEDDDETEEEDEEDEDEEEEPPPPQQSLISDNNNRNNNNNNVINANYYYPSPQTTPNPSPYVSTIQHSFTASSSAAAAASVAAANTTIHKPAIDEDDDYDN